MNKLLVEEINRIREVMGLKLLNESVIPTGTLKTLLTDLIGLAGKNADEIVQNTNIGTRRASLVGVLNDFKQSSDSSIKNFGDSVDEVAKQYGKESSNLLDEILVGKVSDEIQEDIITRIAAKSVGVDPKLLEVLPDNLDWLYKSVQNKYTQYRNDIQFFKNYLLKNPDDYDLLTKLNKDIKDEINTLPQGPFREKLMKDWEEQVKFFDDNFLKGADDAGEQTGKQTDEVVNEVENVKFNQEDLNEVEGVAGTTKPIEGALADYLSKKFKVVGFDSWKKFTVEEQNRIILEMSSKINSSFERTIRDYKWDSGLVSANKTIEQMMKGNLSEKAMEKVFRNAINTAKPSFGTLGNVLDGLVEFTTGISARQGKVFWTTTTGWGEVTKKWILFNLGLAVAEGTYRFYDTREEPTVEGALNILEQRVDFLGLAQRILLPLPLISRLVVSETIQAAIVGGFLNYDGFRQLTEAQITEQFGATNVEILDVNQFPCYDTFADKLKGFSTRANYFKVNGQNKGIWALDLSSGEVVQIQTPMSDDCTTPLVSGTKAATPTPAPAPTTTTTPTLNDFIKFIKSNDGWGGDAPQDDKAYEEVGSNKFRVVLTDGNYDYKANADGTFTYIE